MKIKQRILTTSLALSSASAYAVQTSQCPDNFSVNLQDLSVYSEELVTENSSAGLERNLLARSRLSDRAAGGLPLAQLTLNRTTTGKCYYVDESKNLNARLFTRNGADTLLVESPLIDSPLKIYVNVSAYSKDDGLKTDEEAKIYNVVLDREAEVLTQIGKAQKVIFAKDAAHELSCETEDSTAAAVRILAKGEVFDISASSSAGAALFTVTSQRPALNVRVEDGQNTTVREFIDFNKSGSETVTIGGPTKLEIDLGAGRQALTFAQDEATQIRLTCDVDPTNLIAFLGIKLVKDVRFNATKAVAFDIDDTLLFTSPAFSRGFAAGGVPRPTDKIFWSNVNACDAGCAESTITLPDGAVKVLPANEPSSPKAKAVELIKYHQSLGHKVYAITARPDINGDPLRDYVVSALGINREDIYFEPDLDQENNPSGKTDRIESLNLDVFYGDSDSDITDAQNAFLNTATGSRSKKVQAVRFFRSPKSSNRKAGELNKYHPGYYGELILADSY